MAGCNCGNKGASAPKSFTVSDPKTGKTTSYKTEVEAVAAAKRVGGTYRAA